MSEGVANGFDYLGSSSDKNDFQKVIKKNKSVPGKTIQNQEKYETTLQEPCDQNESVHEQKSFFDEMKTKNQIEDLALVLWDGLGFFSFDIKKIPRMRKKAIKWTDKFTDPFDTPIMMLTLTLIFLVILPIITNYVGNIEKA